MKAAVTLGVLAVLASRADWHGVARGLAHASDTGLLLAFAAFLLVPLLGGLRWWAVLRGLGEPGRPGILTVWFSVGLAIGQMLPTVAGDGMRVWLATRRDYGARPATHSVLLERGLMLLALFALAAVTQPLLAARLGAAAPLWAATLPLLAAVTGLGVLLVADRAVAWVGTSRFTQPVVALSVDARRCLLSPWGAIGFLLALLSNLHFVVVAALLGQALHVDASFADFLAFMPLVIVATTLPISLGGWGVREGVLVALLGAVGVPGGQALALSLTFGAFGACIGIPGLLTWWLQRQPRVATPPPIAQGV